MTSPVYGFVGRLICFLRGHRWAAWYTLAGTNVPAQQARCCTTCGGVNYRYRILQGQDLWKYEHRVWRP